MLFFWTLILLFTISLAEIQQDLGGKWLVDSENETLKGLPATVPGGIYSDLMNNKVIGDILYGYNDVTTRWVGKTSWVYYRNFTVDNSILSNENVNLVFEGLDTLATITINDQQIGTSENMFRRYIFNVKDVLVEGSNSIRVFFKSPIEEAARLAKEQAKSYVVPPECPEKQYNGECHVNMLRKMQASFSWDWGPAFPSVGIWKKVYLEAFNSAVIRYVLVDLEENEENWLINVKTCLNGTTNGILHHSIAIDGVVYNSITNLSGENESKAVITVPQVISNFWWPNGYGEQKLFPLITQFQSSNGELSQQTHNIGFRTIELLQTRTPNNGTNFYFKINNVPIFVKGSNEIPLHILPELGQDPQLIERVLGDAYAVNMNMLRVWGGGVYESDYFYDLADKLGIMIWQDFMFACAMYPTNDNYLKNVKEEVRYQVKRLYNHPSIVIWAGNNENEAALVQNWYGTSGINYNRYKTDYITLYIKTIKAEMENVSKNKIFISSSPSNGIESVKEGYLAKNPQDPKYGDVHFYNYLLNSLDASIYPITRFTSEYGYQCLPDLDAWLTANTNIEDLNPYSNFMVHRQHKALGQQAIELLISYNLKLPLKTHKNFTEAFIFYSQIAQALSIRFETEYYRSFTNRYNEKGLGNNRGMLYWQLNDVWVAPTWSSIDYNGKWKVLHYMLKECFAPNLITGYLNTERELEVYVIAEQPTLSSQVLNVTVHVDVYKWDSLDVLSPYNVTTSIEIGKAVNVLKQPVDDWLISKGCGSLFSAKRNCFIKLRFDIEDLQVSEENFVFPTAIKNAHVPLANIKIASIENLNEDGQTFDITVETDKVALWVWLDAHKIPGRFSKNGFVLLEKTKTVRFNSKKAITPLELTNVLTVTAVNDPKFA